MLLLFMFDARTLSISKPAFLRTDRFIAATAIFPAGPHAAQHTAIGELRRLDADGAMTDVLAAPTKWNTCDKHLAHRTGYEAELRPVHVLLQSPCMIVGVPTLKNGRGMGNFCSSTISIMRSVSRLKGLSTTCATRQKDVACSLSAAHRASLSLCWLRPRQQWSVSACHPVSIPSVPRFLTTPAMEGSRWLYNSAVTAPMERPHKPSVDTVPVERRYSTATLKQRGRQTSVVAVSRRGKGLLQQAEPLLEPYLNIVHLVGSQCDILTI